MAEFYYYLCKTGVGKKQVIFGIKTRFGVLISS